MSNYYELLIWQYRDKPNARATATLINDEMMRSWDSIASLPYALSIEDASGINLDLVGKHVGQSRILTGYTPRNLFGFDGALGAYGFSKNEIGGGRWYRFGDSVSESVRLDDDDYRFLIKCRVAKNYMTGTIEDMSNMLTYLFDASSSVHDQYDMSVTVLVTAEKISDFKRYALVDLDMLPRPAGVKVSFYAAVPRIAFGFLGSTNSAGFNSGVFTRYL